MKFSRRVAIAGGDINDAYRAETDDGRVVFMKTHTSPPAGMYVAEAAGLRWLAEANVLPVPRVVAVEESFLALEWIERAPKRADHDEILGRGLGALHRCGAPAFGGFIDNFIGRLPQSNLSSERWSTFYGERRLAAQLNDAVPAALRRAVERVIGRLPVLVEVEPPARLHGDLWGGNVMTDASGGPVLIDPAPYGGSREVDLAMMRLFGGFAPRVFSSYEEVFPLSPGADERVELYQLYPLLVHVNLFGGAYAESALRIARRYE